MAVASFAIGHRAVVVACYRSGSRLEIWVSVAHWHRTLMLRVRVWPVIGSSGVALRFRDPVARARGSERLACWLAVLTRRPGWTWSRVLLPETSCLDRCVGLVAIGA
jgi:hypothetical protein